MHRPRPHGSHVRWLDPDRLRDAEQLRPGEEGRARMVLSALRRRGSSRRRRSARRATARGRRARRGARGGRCLDRGRRLRRRRGSRARPTRTPPRACRRAAPTVAATTPVWDRAGVDVQRVVSARVAADEAVGEQRVGDPSSARRRRPPTGGGGTGSRSTCAGATSATSVSPSHTCPSATSQRHLEAAAGCSSVTTARPSLRSALDQAAGVPAVRRVSRPAGSGGR